MCWVSYSIFLDQESGAEFTAISGVNIFWTVCMAYSLERMSALKRYKVIEMILILRTRFDLLNA